MAKSVIRQGAIYDPVHDRDGVVADLWIEDGRIIATPVDPQVRPDVVIDATGCVVMPGGVDMHCHIAGPKVNAARRLLPGATRMAAQLETREGFRAGNAGPVPSSFATGYLYAGLGYTTAFDAAIPPLHARAVHAEFADVPILDKGFYTLLGNNRFMMDCLRKRDPASLEAFVAWVLEASYGYGVKIVNPGGVEYWKSARLPLDDIDQAIGDEHVTPRAIVRQLAAAADRLQLPHPVHIHCNHLGIPGNWKTTLATMQSLEGRRGHFTHIQYHSYAGEPNDQATFGSATRQLVEYVESHPEITVDVGQVMFGDTVSMTGDSEVGYYLHKLTGRRWFSGDSEVEGGCGVVPITYRDKSAVHGLQWAIGLEWYLLMGDPWRIAMSTDHPNGASFLAYPQIIALLMSESLRAEMLARLPESVRQKTILGDLKREYTLREIAIITRAAPARMLGLTSKGHLGPGADADITIYSRQDDLRKMFEMPRYVLKGGEIIVDGGELRRSTAGQTWHTRRPWDESFEPKIKEFFDEHYTLNLANYVLEPEDVAAPVTG
ncbi:MAG: formylmethanofuran dehydrogenase subunit A [Planctomyces sp.]|nr:formylmethanofuran dehydrogenase subunit A [Planctomyces sp.]